MDNKELKELMEFISQSNFVEFELERDDFKLKLVKDAARQKGLNGAGAELAHFVIPAPAPAPPAPQAQIPPAAAPAPAPAADVLQVTSPMVGTFYRASNPTAPPFVQVGDTVKKGQVLCIIEAMKLMNEIESEVAGEVLDIPVSNGQPVEYGEVLFRIRLVNP
ncbi:MAG TPA: acetyl-CoA carboxylase biotin carboxyl carrier protein [Candidatus Polarisedimenticolia bacterium]|nr:acetyl-CoA carboxylase biotin carboxyl carrier protein [Candidatus Polarisedimenticolia bacterium]